MAQIAMGLDVYVDGVRVNDAYAFNVAEGWVDCHTHSPSKYHNKDAGVGEFLSSRLWGVIEVERRQVRGKEIEGIEIDVDLTGVNEATEAMDKLADAAEKATAAIDRLRQQGTIDELYAEWLK